MRLAPRRWHLRATVEAEVKRLEPLDLLANAVLSLVRASAAALEDRERLPSTLCEEISALGPAFAQLANTQQPWPPRLVAEVGDIASHAIEHATTPKADRAPAIASLLRATRHDLVNLVQGGDRAAG